MDCTRQFKVSGRALKLMLNSDVNKNQTRFLSVFIDVLYNYLLSLLKYESNGSMIYVSP